MIYPLFFSPSPLSFPLLLFPSYCALTYPQGDSGSLSFGGGWEGFGGMRWGRGATHGDELGSGAAGGGSGG